MDTKFGRTGPRPSVIIVGAGAGGVATAARLAAAGCKVTVVEKNEFSGGRCSLIHRDGFVCPRVLSWIPSARETRKKQKS